MCQQGLYNNSSMLGRNQQTMKKRVQSAQRFKQSVTKVIQGHPSEKNIKSL